jgi:hypothetical protein
MLAEVSHAEALDLACRTLAGVLHAARPRLANPIGDQASYITLCLHVEQWVTRELTPLRFRGTKGSVIG